MATITLPTRDGGLEPHRLSAASSFPDTRPAAARPWTRVAYAAAHVVAKPLDSDSPWTTGGAIDWDATLAYRERLWGLGFKIAEAMDTSQRGMGLDWPAAAALIRRSVALSRHHAGADLACGVGTDQLAATPDVTLDSVIRAYEEQLAVVEEVGGRAILMASRALVRAARSADDYDAVYGRLIGQASGKVILHWLGAMFDPALAGYWGTDDFDTALDRVVALITAHADRIDGIKISLLDQDKEIRLRDRLPAGVAMYTGDDFNYPALIAGDGRRHSHALLGIFDPIAPAASAALQALAEDDHARYAAIMEPTIPLSRAIFEAPTQFYKAGVVFMAWLNGHQDHFTMIGGMQSARGIRHYAEVFRLADRAGLLRDPDLAVRRMRALLTLHGVE